MLGLPKSTELNRQLPKKAIYAKFDINAAARERFDADISRIAIVNEISPQTVPALAATEEIASFHVLLVTLKRKEYEEQTVAQLTKLINQKMLLVLEYSGECRLAVYHTKLMQGAWQKSADCAVSLKGVDLGAVWQNIVTQIGEIEVEEGHTLEQQIASDEQRAKVQKEIERLERLARKEVQPKKKFELVKRIRALQSDLEDLS